MFLVNSRLDLIIATFFKVPLLPKLRSYFAEFLRESSLAPLGILYQPTCVGFRYRRFLIMTVQAFLGSVTSTTSFPPHNTLAQNIFSISHNLECLDQLPFRYTDALDKFSLLRPSLSLKNGIGILTYCPSTTPFDLALGPD